MRDFDDLPEQCPKCAHQADLSESGMLWRGPRYGIGLTESGMGGPIGPSIVDLDDYLSYECSRCEFEIRTRCLDAQERAWQKASGRGPASLDTGVIS